MGGGGVIRWGSIWGGEQLGEGQYGGGGTIRWESIIIGGIFMGIYEDILFQKIFPPNLTRCLLNLI